MSAHCHTCWYVFQVDSTTPLNTVLLPHASFIIKHYVDDEEMSTSNVKVPLLSSLSVPS